MKELIENLLDKTPLALIIIGLVVLVVGATGTIPISSPPLQLTSPIWQITFSAIGIVFLLSGLCIVILQTRKELSLEKKARHQQSSQASNSAQELEFDEKQIVEEIKCDGELLDLYLMEDGRMLEMPKERCWKYELDNIVIKKYPLKLSLSYTAKIKAPGGDESEMYTSYGVGAFVDGVAYFDYSYKSVVAGGSSWEGVMVLRVPRHGIIHGVWLTTNVNTDKKFPIGSIRLKRKLT